MRPQNVQLFSQFHTSIKPSQSLSEPITLLSLVTPPHRGSHPILSPLRDDCRGQSCPDELESAPAEIYPKSRLQKEVFANPDRVQRAPYAVADGAGIFVDLVVIPTLVGLVSKEVDLFEAFRLDVSQCVRFVPSHREDIEGDLATDGEGEAVIRELGLESGDEGRAEVMYLCGHAAG